MAAYDLEEQEQLANIKAWWDRYGNKLTTVVTVLAIGVLAYQGWNWYQRKQATEAANVYNTLQQGVVQNDAQKIREASGDILSKYEKTGYADLAALIAAAKQIENKDIKSARSKLEWASSHANDPLLRDLARLRLAALLGEEKNYAQALKTLETTPDAVFTARYADLRGDLLLAQGNKEKARQAYQQAADALNKKPQDGDAENSAEANKVFAMLIKTKLEALGS